MCRGAGGEGNLVVVTYYGKAAFFVCGFCKLTRTLTKTKQLQQILRLETRFRKIVKEVCITVYKATRTP